MSNLLDIQYRPPPPPPPKKIKLVKFLIESCREKLFIFEDSKSDTVVYPVFKLQWDHYKASMNKLHWVVLDRK